MLQHTRQIQCFFDHLRRIWCLIRRLSLLSLCTPSF